MNDEKKLWWWFIVNHYLRKAVPILTFGFKTRLNPNKDLKKEFLLYRLFIEIEKRIDSGDEIDYEKIFMSDYERRFRFGDTVFTVWVANKPYADARLTFFEQQMENQTKHHLYAISGEGEITPNEFLASVVRRVTSKILLGSGQNEIPLPMFSKQVTREMVDEMIAYHDLEKL